MSPGLIGLLGAALCAAGAVDGPRMALNLPIESMPIPLPPPPSRAVLETPYFGNVTVDHEAHLRRRVHCVECHDPGRVSRIAFTPKVAHERCRGCHVAINKGPTDCRGCHVAAPKEPPTMMAAAPPTGAPDEAAKRTSARAGSASTLAASASAHATAAAAAAAAGAAAAGELPPGPDADAATPPAVGATASTPDEGAFLRTVQLGAAAGTGYGLSARLVSRQGVRVLSHGIERLGGGGSTRTLLLLGAGARLPVPVPMAPAVGLFAEGIVGLDAWFTPSVELVPALGARLGLEWTPRWAFRFPVLLSVTALVDTVRVEDQSPLCVYATVGLGAQLQRR